MLRLRAQDLWTLLQCGMNMDGAQVLNMRRLPPLGALEAFVAVAQRQSLKLAAEDLNLSPSALSRRVQALEAHVGRRVFDRIGGEFRLTDAGRGLLDQVLPVIDSLTRALDQARGDGDETLNLGVMPAFANAWLLPRLSRFRSRYPTVDVALDTSSAPLSRLPAGLDAAIIVAEQPESGLYSRQLCQQRVIGVCAPELAAGAPPLRGPEDLAHHTVMVHRRMPELLELWLAALPNRVQPKRVEFFDSGPLLLEAATLGLGVAVAFDTMASTHLTSGRLIRPFDEDVDSPLNYWFFCREGALAKRPVRRFHDWLFEETAAQAA